MPQIPITNIYGEVAYGAATPFEAPDYTPLIVESIQRGMEAQQKAMEEARKERARQESLTRKYKHEFNRLLMTSQKEILPYHQEDLSAMAMDIVDTMRQEEAAAKKGGWIYDPEDSDELFMKMYNLKNNVLNWGGEYKTVQKELLVKGDPNRSGDIEWNEDLYSALAGKDKNAVFEALKKGGVRSAEDVGYYTGVGGYVPLDTRKWYENTTKAMKGVAIKENTIDLGGGIYKDITKLTDEDYNTFVNTYMLGAGRDVKALMTQNLGLTQPQAYKTIEDLAKTQLQNRVKEHIRGGARGLEITIGAGGITTKKGSYFNITEGGKGGVYGNIGVSEIPIKRFHDKQGNIVIGKPTGEMINRGTTEKPILEMAMEVFEPIPRYTAGMSVEDFMEKYPPDQYGRYYTKKEKTQWLPLTGNSFNTEKWKAEHFDNLKTPEQAYLDAMKSLKKEPVQKIIPTEKKKYKFTKSYLGVMYGRNNETENWKKIE